MKVIVILLAILATVGFAAAWDTTDTLQYQYTHEMYQQAGDPSGFMNGAVSEAAFSALNPYGPGQGMVANKVTGVTTTESPTSSGLLQPSQTLTLTQGGSAVLGTSALDSQDNKPELQASVSNFQNLHFSGVYTGVSATFANEGNVGIGDPIRVTETTNPSSTAGGVTALGGAKFAEADVGVQSSSGLTWDMVTDLKTLSGSSTAYSAFTGGIAPAGATIETNSGNFITDTKWSSLAPVMPNTMYPNF
ncbi:MAG: hypothetical protein ACE14P_00710 [Methanotrichaceae archaeon]